MEEFVGLFLADLITHGLYFFLNLAGKLLACAKASFVHILILMIVLLFLENKQVSPGPARKVTKSSFNLPEIAPKVKSFYEQIDIEQKVDLTDGQTESMDICQDKEPVEVLTEEKVLSSETQVNTEHVDSSVENGSTSIVTNEAGGKMDEVEDAADSVVCSITGKSSLISNETEEHEVMSEAKEDEVTSSSEDSVIAEDHAVVVNNEREIEDHDSQDDEKDFKESEESSENKFIATEPVAEANNVDSTEKLNSLMRESTAEAETGKDGVGICDSNEANETEMEPSDDIVCICDGNDVSKVEETPDETEESVLDYFMETINFAAELDNEAPVSEGSSQESVVDENGTQDKLQPDLAENELQDSVCEGSTDEITNPLECDAVCSTEGASDGNQEGGEDNVEMDGSEESWNIVDTPGVDVDGIEVTGGESRSNDAQNSEPIETEPANTESEKELSCEEPDVSVTGLISSEAELYEESTPLPEDDLETNDESSPSIEPPSPGSHDDTEASDLAECRSDGEDQREGLSSDAECSSKDATADGIVEQNISANNLSVNCEFTTIQCTDESNTKDVVTESVSVNRKIETDV